MYKMLVLPVAMASGTFAITFSTVTVVAEASIAPTSLPTTSEAQTTDISNHLPTATSAKPSIPLGTLTQGANTTSVVVTATSRTMAGPLVTRAPKVDITTLKTLLKSDIEPRRFVSDYDGHIITNRPCRIATHT
jgi:hypothetical protein